MNIEEIKAKVTDATRRSSFCLATINGTDTWYVPIPPVTDDTEELCDAFDRVMLCHSRTGIEILRAPKGIMNYGWVIGIIPN